MCESLFVCILMSLSDALSLSVCVFFLSCFSLVCIVFYNILSIGSLLKPYMFCFLMITLHGLVLDISLDKLFSVQYYQ